MPIKWKTKHIQNKFQANTNRKTTTRAPSQKLPDNVKAETNMMMQTTYRIKISGRSSNVHITL